MAEKPDKDPKNTDGDKDQNKSGSPPAAAPAKLTPSNLPPPKAPAPVKPRTASHYRILSSGAGPWVRGNIVTHEEIKEAGYIPEHWLRIEGIEPCEPPKA